MLINEEKQTRDIVAEYELERHKPMPSYNHSIIQTNIIVELAAYKKQYNIASELNLNLSDWKAIPDISLYPAAPLDTKHDQIWVTDPPLCVIEILSVQQPLADVITKAYEYFDRGVGSCWIVIPALNNVYVFSAADQYEMYKTGETLRDEKMDIELEVSKVFA